MHFQPEYKMLMVERIHRRSLRLPGNPAGTSSRRAISFQERYNPLWLPPHHSGWSGPFLSTSLPVPAIAKGLQWPRVSDQICGVRVHTGYSENWTGSAAATDSWKAQDYHDCRPVAGNSEKPGIGWSSCLNPHLYLPVQSPSIIWQPLDLCQSQ